MLHAVCISAVAVERVVAHRPLASISHSKDFSGTTAPLILKFGTHFGYNYLYRVRQNQRPHLYHSLYLSIFFFFSNIFFFFCQRVSGTTAPRILKFGTHIGYNYLYRVRQNQHPHFYHSLYLSIFLFLQFFFFFQRFSGTTAPRILKYGTNIGYG